VSHLATFNQIKHVIFVLTVGPPDPPQDLIVTGIRVPNKRTVDVNLTWTPGYAGGEQQFFTVLYKLNSVEVEVFTEIVIDNAAGTQYTIKDLKPYTSYVFKIRPRNSKGLGKESKEVYYTTPGEHLAFIYTHQNQDT
jgi:hypothetical protein